MSEIQVDTVAEKTSANGVTVDGLNIKDSKLVTANSVITSNITNANITLDKMAANSVDSNQYVNNSIDTDHLGADQVTYAKIQNVSATDRILGRDSSGAGIIEEITPANLRTMINVADGATAGGGGKLLQSFNKVIAAASGTTTIPFDNSTPTTSEGTLIFEQAITCAATSSKVRITGVVNCGAIGQDSSNGFGIAVFRDNTCVGMYAFQDWTANTDLSYAIPVHIVDAPSSTSALTYKLRVGNLYDSNHNTTTWKVGGSATGRGNKFNGKLALNTIELNEIGA